MFYSIKALADTGEVKKTAPKKNTKANSTKKESKK